MRAVLLSRLPCCQWSSAELFSFAQADECSAHPLCRALTGVRLQPATLMWRTFLILVPSYPTISGDLGVEAIVVNALAKPLIQDPTDMNAFPALVVTLL